MCSTCVSLMGTIRKPCHVGCGLHERFCRPLRLGLMSVGFGCSSDGSVVSFRDPARSRVFGFPLPSIQLGVLAGYREGYAVCPNPFPLAALIPVRLSGINLLSLCYFISVGYWYFYMYYVLLFMLVVVLCFRVVNFLL